MYCKITSFVGSMGCVHIGCLEQWLNFSSHNFCELCSYKFEVVQVRRYSFFQSIIVWVRRDHTSIYKTLIFLFLSTINSALLSWLWFLWISNIPNTFFKNKLNEDSKNETKEEQEISKTKWVIVFIFLTLLTVFSVKSLCFDVYKIIRNRYNSWHSWWNETVNVQLVVDLQNYKINAKLDKTDVFPIKKSEEHLPNNGQENMDSQEIKTSNSQYEQTNTDTTNNFEILIPQTQNYDNHNNSNDK